MRIARVKLTGFKRFDDLTIVLGDNPAKVIALVGPNGCGKSSVFDAFDTKLTQIKQAQRGRESDDFYSKHLFSEDPAEQGQTFNKANSVLITTTTPGTALSKKSFLIRSAYRFTSKLQLGQIQAQPSILDDHQRPMSSIDMDGRLTENYARLVGQAYEAFEKGQKTGKEVRDELVGKLNTVLKSVLDIQVESLGEITKGKGELYFRKGKSRNFPYKNLSSGEKEVVDIIVDLIVRAPEFNDTVFCIDEPELHLNTGIQRKLLKGIAGLIPDNCQLWVATHSAGFLRALQEDLANDSMVLDFGETDYFNGEKTIRPMERTRQNWRRVFDTALDDLSGLLAPKRVTYCEGKIGKRTSVEQGFDANVYNQLFAKTQGDCLFVSSGGGAEAVKNSSLAIHVLRKALLDVDIMLLKDRDELSAAERNKFLGEGKHHRMLKRREIENYLLDKQVLATFCTSKGLAFNEATYNQIVTDIDNQDLKVGDTITRLRDLCGVTGSNEKFMLGLVPTMATVQPVYAEVEDCAFRQTMSPVPSAAATTTALTAAPVPVQAPPTPAGVP